MIELLNVKEGDIYEHSLIYFFGKCFDAKNSSIEVIDKFGNSINWKIVNTYFKVNLNSIKLQSNSNIRGEI